MVFRDHLRITGTADANNTVKILNNQNQLIASCGANARGAFSVLTTSPPSGTYVLSAKSFDAAGNFSKLSGSRSVTMSAHSATNANNFTGLTGGSS